MSRMAIISLGKRSVFSLRGTDAIRYLNGQVTQDVRLLLADPTAALLTFVTDAKGKLQALCTMYLIDAVTPEIRIEAPLCLRDALYARLSRYLIADDVEIEDQSDQWVLLHSNEETLEGISYACARYGSLGRDLWWPTLQALPSNVVSEETMEATRIRHGIPQWGAELVEGMLVAEAGMAQRTISYHKGCYIGQEVISRIKSAGKINRTVQAFLLDSASACVGSVVQYDGEEVGLLTSVAYPYALGMLGKKGIGQTKFDLRLPDGQLLLMAAIIADQR